MGPLTISLSWRFDVIERGKKPKTQVSNVSTAGDPIDVTDKIASQYKKVAEKAANRLEAKFCGIDMIIDGDLAVEVHRHSIIELNYNPALSCARKSISSRRGGAR